MGIKYGKSPGEEPLKAAQEFERARMAQQKVDSDLLGVKANKARKYDALQEGLGSGVCPTCGQRTRPMTNAERQARYRERKEEKEV